MTRRRDGIGPDLAGRRLLVTGGGTGIGAATAQLAAEAGMKVMVTGRRAEPLDRVVAGIVAAGGEAVTHVGDVAASRPAAVAAYRDTGLFVCLSYEREPLRAPRHR